MHLLNQQNAVGQAHLNVSYFISRQMHFISCEVHNAHANVKVKEGRGESIKPTEDAFKKRRSPQN